MNTDRKRTGFPMLWPAIDVCMAVAIITLATGAMQFFEQESAKPADALALRTLATEVEERIAALQARCDELVRERAQFPDEVLEADLQALEAERMRLLDNLANLRRDLEQAEAARKAAERQAGDAEQQRQRLRAAVDRLQQQITELERQLASLEAQLKQLQYDREQIERLTKELEDVKRQLEDARKRHVELQEQIGRKKKMLDKPAVTLEVHPRTTDPGNRQLHGVVISQATVTPVREPYYQPIFRDVPGGRRVTGLRFVRPGGALNDALQRGSNFQRWLDTLDPNREYVFLWVDSASFETFRAVRQELRKRGIQCGWEPDNNGNEDIVFNSLPPGVERKPPPIQ